MSIAISVLGISCALLAYAEHLLSISHALIVFSEHLRASEAQQMLLDPRIISRAFL